jgi:hypothetical protein
MAREDLLPADDWLNEKPDATYTPYKSYGVAKSEMSSAAARVPRDDLLPARLEDLGGSYYQPTPEQTGGEGFMPSLKRGATTAIKQLPQTAYGLLALGADTVGADSVRDYGMQKYKQWGDEIEKEARPSDSFWDAMSKDDVSLLDWTGYATGYIGGQVATGLGIGALGKMAAKKVAGGYIERMVADKVAKGVVAQTAKAEALEQAAWKLGGMTAFAALNATQELGSIYGEAVDQQEKTGEQVNLAKVWLSGILAAGVDTVMDSSTIAKLFTGAGTGKSLARIAKQGAIEFTKQAGTEGIQTALERWGANQSLGDQEAWKSYVDAMAIGGFGGALGGGAAGLRGAPQAAQPAPPAPPTDPLASLPEEDIAATPGERAAQKPMTADDLAKQSERTYGLARLGMQPTGAAGIDQTLLGLGQQSAKDIASARTTQQNYWDEVRRVAESVTAKAEKKELPDVRAGIAELTGAADTALRTMKNRPDVYETIGEAAAALDAVADGQAQTPARGVAEMTPPPLKGLVQGLQPQGIAGTINQASGDLDAIAKARKANGEQAQMRSQPAQINAGAPQAGPVAPPPPPASAAAPAPSTAPLTTTPEPQSDVQAQIAAMLDPANPKDSVFVADGTALPPVPEGVTSIKKKGGTLLTTNAEKAKKFRRSKVTDELVAEMLAIPQPKSEVAGTPEAVQAKDAQGNVVAEAVTDGTGGNEAAVAAQTPPGGSVGFVAPEAALAQRAEKVAAEPVANATQPTANANAPTTTDTKQTPEPAAATMPAQTEQAVSRKPKLDAKSLAGVKIQIETQVADTGEVVFVEQDAKTALKDARAKLRRAEALLKCVSA